MKEILTNLKNYITDELKRTIDRLFFWISATALLLLIIVAYNSNEIYTQNSLTLKLHDLTNINDAIDNHINSEFSVIRTDLINEHLKQIDNIIEDISKNTDYTQFFSDQEANRIFSEIKDNVKANEVALNEFITHKAVIMEKILELSTNLRNTKEIRTLAGFFSRILLSRFGEIFDSNLFAQDLREYRSGVSSSVDDGSQIDYNYSLFLIQLNEEITQLVGITERREQVSNMINILSKELIDKLESRSSNLKNIFDIILVCVAFLIIIFMIKLRPNQKAIIQMAEREKQIKEMLEHSSDTIMEIDLKNIIKTINYSSDAQKYPQIGTKLDIIDKSGNPIDIIEKLVQNNKLNIAQISRKARISKEKENEIEEKSLETDVVRVKEGEDGYNYATHESLYASPIHKHGKLVGANVVLIDFTRQFNAEFKLKKSGDELERASKTDKETMLPNHLALSSDLQKANEHGYRKYVVYISIDQFENFQFFYNETTVSLILREVSKTIILCMRNYNIKSFELYHLQEDKFCLLCEERDRDGLAEKLLNYFSSTIVLKDNNNHDITLNISLRLGFSNDVDSDTDRLTQAKLAHQKARQMEDPYFIYEQNNDNERTYRNNQIVSRMIRYALNNNKITVECQPIYNLTKPLPGGNNYELFSYEILVRLYDDEGKMHYPGEFLDVAKQAGLYISITKAVVNIAFDLVEKFEHVFSINLSSSDMANDGVRELFNARLKECSAPHRLTIEVLETEDIKQKMDDVLKFLDDVRNKGCHVAIDDFGSGFANIATILQLNIDYIKIDGSIIQRLPYDEDSRAFLHMLSNFAASANYTMVAEFVSSQAILDQVKALGVQYAQGYLLGKPTKLL